MVKTGPDPSLHLMENRRWSGFFGEFERERETVRFRMRFIRRRRPGPGRSAATWSRGTASFRCGGDRRDREPDLGRRRRPHREGRRHSSGRRPGRICTILESEAWRLRSSRIDGVVADPIQAAAVPSVSRAPGRDRLVPAGSGAFARPADVLPPPDGSRRPRRPRGTGEREFPARANFRKGLPFSGTAPRPYHDPIIGITSRGPFRSS